MLSGSATGYYFKIACVASVSVRFRSKERGTKVNFRATKIKNAVQELVVPRSFFAPKPHGKTLATQAIFQKDLKFIVFCDYLLLEQTFIVNLSGYATATASRGLSAQ